MPLLANYSVDKTNSKVGHSKYDKNYRHDKISKVETRIDQFGSLALEVVLKNENCK